MENEQATSSIQEQQEQPKEKQNKFEIKRSAISECIEKIEEFTSALKEVCSKSDQMVSSLHVLERLAVPEVIGSPVNMKMPKKQIFDNTGYLIERLNTFNE
jgi:hypothetical protein